MQHNDQLQRAGQAPVYYWLPEHVTLAKRDNGDYKFSMIHFVGVRASERTLSGGAATVKNVNKPPAISLSLLVSCSCRTRRLHGLCAVDFRDVGTFGTAENSAAKGCPTEVLSSAEPYVPSNQEETHGHTK
jgi:hypothetical protein